MADDLMPNHEFCASVAECRAAESSYRGQYFEDIDGGSWKSENCPRIYPEKSAMRRYDRCTGPAMATRKSLAGVCRRWLNDQVLG